MLQFNRPQVWALALLALGLASRSSASELEKYFPEATEVVVTVNVRQILQSALLASELGRIRRELERNAQVKQTLESIGFDPLKDLDSLSLASAGPSDTEKTLLVMAGRFDQKIIQAKAEEVARGKGAFLKIHQERGQSIYETNVPGQSKSVFVAILDAATLVASFKKEYVLDALDINAGTKKAALHLEVRQLLEKSARARSFNLVGLGSALPKGLPQVDKIRHIVGGITLGEKISTDFTIAVADAPSATALARLLREGIDQGKNFLTLMAMNQKELGPLVEVLGSLKVNEQGSEITLRGEVTKESLEQLKKKQ